MSDLLRLKEDGYLLKTGVLSAEQCKEALLTMESRPAAVNIPYSSVAWGYGNMLADETFSFVVNNETIKSVCKQYLGDTYVFNHLMLNNKAAFIGPDVEWHQEEFNINTFAPIEASDDNLWMSFLQVYVALDDHTVENGCLKIVPGSHKLGLLPHEDIVNTNHSHKRRVPYLVMKKICNDHDIMNVEMSRGDVLFFVHRMLHASASNASAQERRSLVIQGRRPFQRSEGVYTKEIEYRKSFIINSMMASLERFEDKNVYNDFREEKDES
jgi:hypothetical protein